VHAPLFALHPLIHPVQTVEEVQVAQLALTEVHGVQLDIS